MFHYLCKNLKSKKAKLNQTRLREFNEIELRSYPAFLRKIFTQ